MKTLECSKCHRLFRSSSDHITIYLHDRPNENYCTSCTDMFLGFCKIGMMFSDKISTNGNTIIMFDERGQEGDVYDD